MRHFFALPAVLRAAAIIASASPQTFSVHDDLLAFPQYEIRLDENWISEEDAQERLLSKPGETTVYEGKQDEDAVGQYQGSHGDGKDGFAGAESVEDAVPVEYEYMVMDGQRWLCSVPIVKKVTEAEGTNDTLSHAEQERELARATDRGWELLSGMKDHCVYFISGWWSYKFCYNQGVKQFHQLPPSRGVPAYPPVEDPGVEGYVLGTYDKRVDDDERPAREEWTGGSAVGKSESAKRRSSGSGELVQRGESRYLVQHLAGGTVCDLTGKDRNIEVQFHCNPSSGDRISLIKETTTCAYLMVIQTPRLCNDVAFQPPQEDRPNSVKCSPILAENEVDGYETDLAAIKASERKANILEAQAAAAAALGASTFGAPPPLVGDIYVGAHAVIPEDQKIKRSAIVGGGKEVYIDTVASSDGKRLSKEDLERLGLGDPRSVEKLKKELEKLAEGQYWKLDVVDTAQGREYRGIIGEDEEDVKRKGAQPQKDTKKNSGTTDGKKTQKKKADDDKSSSGNKNNNKNSKKNQGSEEEFFKEEL